MSLASCAQADAVASSPSAAKAARETDWANLHESIKPAKVVATSARDGRGLDKLMSAVEAALLSLCSKVDCVLPYSEAALLAEAHKVRCACDHSELEAPDHRVRPDHGFPLHGQCGEPERACVFVHACFLQTGTIIHEEYEDNGTHLVAYVPVSLRNRLEKVASSFSDEEPQRERASPGPASPESR